MIKNKKTLSSIEVERILGISRRTLFNWTKKGKLRYIRLPSGHKRYFREDIENILNKINK